jgi:putative hydrolase
MSEALVKVMGHSPDGGAGGDSGTSGGDGGTGEIDFGFGRIPGIDAGAGDTLDDDGGFGGLGADTLSRLGLGGLNPSQLLKRLGATAYGMQIGQAAGVLSREVFGITDLGFPLVTSPNKALVPANVVTYAKDLEIPADQLTTYLAVREAATARLFAAKPWLRAHLESLIEQYARQIEIDLRQLEEQMHGVDPSNQAQLGKAMTGGLFSPAVTPEQQATLLRLETALALIEGWVEEVTTAATIAHLPSSMALREMLRRRRGAGGPAEQAFASLVGLELLPRRSRDAAKLFSHVYTAGGVEGRDAVFDHPDLLPTAADLDDPAGYLARRISRDEATSDLDAALAEILGGSA